MATIVSAPARDYRHGEYVQWGEDASLHVRFYLHPVTEETHIRIEIPNDPNSVVDRTVEELDKIRFSDQWQAYQDGQSQFGDATALSAVPWVDEATIKELSKLNVFTVEQLSGLSDEILLRIYQVVPGLRDLRAKAQEHLQGEEARKQHAETMTSIEELRKQVEALSKENESLKQKVEAPEGESPFS